MTYSTTKEYKKEWYQKNKHIWAEYYQRTKEEKRKERYETLKKYRKNNPWSISLNKARARCNNPKQKGYKNYGGKGIRCLLTIKEIKYLWFRDKSYLMKKPSIDRIDSNRDYIFENCRFIELSINSGRTSRTKK